jgi:hypothetical protein
VPNLHIYATSLPQRLALLYLQPINLLSSVSASAGAKKVNTLTDTVSFCATALSLSREAGQRHHDLSLSLLSQVNTMEVQQDFRDLIELFNKHRIDYIVVGSYALGFHGAPRYTGDLDVFVKPDPANERRIMQALDEFGFGSVIQRKS